MKENDVAAFATLFNTTAENVNQAIENGTVSELINGFKTGNKIMPNADFDTFQTNLKRQALTELDKNNLPKDVYDYVKASVKEKTERQLAKQYGISDYQNLDHLVESIIKTKTNTTPDEDVKALKQRITDMEADHQLKIESIGKQHETRFIDNELKRVIGKLPIDADGAKLENQQEIVMAMVKAKFNFSIDGDNIVTFKDGKPVRDTKLDPVPMAKIIEEFAKDYVNLRLDQGGRGDSSSHNGSKTINFAEYCEKNGLRPNTIELVKAQKELLEKGFKLE